LTESKVAEESAKMRNTFLRISRAGKVRQFGALAWETNAAKETDASVSSREKEPGHRKENSLSLNVQ
jgi:hypothetical protein